jgi:hypothetical protein
MKEHKVVGGEVVSVHTTLYGEKKKKNGKKKCPHNIMMESH